MTFLKKYIKKFANDKTFTYLCTIIKNKKK